MTSHRAAETMNHPAQPVERAVTAGLLLAVVAGLAWTGGTIYTVLVWSLQGATGGPPSGR
ncbi:morphogenic membrane protein MmpA [Streptomyces chiangmaiensis]|uniref:Uncharacterized protein n=1 Tax=Streptomyces chiangmaiensis TaxID=766497 RepID=A0ABU7FU66_9ACTN|nr:hypothetical protein [Streptomyces chiangmaiensis]MED7827440.1 hypothetical protein [Streptomyces chiangmaiensis]